MGQWVYQWDMLIEKEVCQCEQCGHEWLPVGGLIPKRCARCKSSKWNETGGHKSAIRSLDADGIAKALEGLPGVRKGKKSAAVQEPVVEPENAMDEDIEAMMPEMCPYTEYNTDTGETYACALEVHGPKIRHKMGAKVG